MEHDIFQKEDFLQNEFYQPFLVEDFDVKEHASKVLQGSVVSEQLSKLSEGLSLLDKTIHNQVLEHYEDLLKHASGIETLENVISMMQAHIQGFSASIERLKVRISEPHKKLQIQTLMLSRLQTSCELLRRVVRIMSLSKRLETHLQAGSKEITKSAQTLSELDQLTRDVDLSGVEIIEKDQKLIFQARVEVEKQAKIMLQRGLEVQNQSQVGTALQVFHNLGALQSTVESVLENARETLHSGLKHALNIEQLSQSNNPSGSGGIHHGTDGKFKGPGRVAMPVTGSSPAFRTALWVNMEKLMEKIFTCCAQVQHLQKVLAKKRDPVTHVCFLEELNQNRNTHLVQRFWALVTELLTQEFNRAANESSHIKQAFEAEYPKLLRLSVDLWGKLQQFSHEIANVSNTTNMISDDFIDDDQEVGTLNQFNAETALRKSLSSFQNAYLSRSLSRLFDPVNLLFSGGNDGLPSVDECDNLIKIIISELSVSLVDVKLGQLVTKNVTKTIQMIAVKAEQLIISDGEASQVIGPPTSAQKNNAGVVNLLHQFDRHLRRSLASLTGLPSDCQASVVDSLNHVTVLMRNSLQPLLLSVTDAVEAILLTMHDEDFSETQVSESGSSPCSLYMTELQNFMARSAVDYFTLYHATDLVNEELRLVAIRCLDLFVRHASLLRSLGEGGKMKLAADFAQMELAITSFYDRPTELGRSYRILRSFRPLLFQTVDHLSQSAVVGDLIPYSLVLHFLFARAPSELKSPHQGAGWSVVRYSKWLDDHSSEKERLSVIQSALESYVQSVKQRQGKEFAKEYAVMVQLLQKALASP